MKLLRPIVICFLLAFCTLGQAKVRLPHMLSDGMVLQQNTDVRLWGWARPGSIVRVKTSWSQKQATVRADEEGKWLIAVRTPAASYAPLEITIDDVEGETVKLNNILAGEVWVCAGQSNMEFPVKGLPNCPLEGYNEAVIEASHTRGIRYLTVPRRMSVRPLDDADSQWTDINSATVGDCCAVGYFFALTVNKALNIPVGLILANRGGTRVESWLDESNLRQFTNETLDSLDMTKRFSVDYKYPLLWGNGTFHPILNYTVKGILFYQGCSNVGDPGNQYSERLKLLVEQWRRDFREPDMPFYFVQLVPHADRGSKDAIRRALLCEQQLRASDIIPNSGLICTNDLAYPYEYSQIHPCQKKPVGERLAYMALKRNYGMDQLIADSPRFKDMEIEGDQCYLRFSNLFGGYSRTTEIEGFELAGEDKVFYSAKAEYYNKKGDTKHGNSIRVWSDRVACPVAVRYCFRNFQLGNLKNAGGQPLFPFRTDNWQ